MGGENGPPILNGGSDDYDRVLAFDAPVEFDTGLFAPPDVKTLAQLREQMMIRLGYAAMLASPPPGMTQLLNSFLDDAQQQLYVRYDCLRTARWFAWQMVPGRRIYDVPINGVEYLNFRKVDRVSITDNGGRALQAFPGAIAVTLGTFLLPTIATGLEYEVTTAGTLDGTEPAWPTTIGATVTSGTATLTARAAAPQTWLPMVEGIDPMTYNDRNAAMPYRYALGRYLEVFPVPDKPYVVWLHGHIGLMRFAEDDDVATIDSHPLFLFALALAKDHYLNAGDKYASMATRMIAHLVAGSHGTRRYIPHEAVGGMKPEYRHDDRPWPMPIGTWRGG